MFSSPTSARLQEIGPRFTLKLRWLRKGLPGVTAPDGSISRGGDVQVDEDEDEKMDEDEAMREMGKGGGEGTTIGKMTDKEMGIPALDEEQEYEWKWKVSLALRVAGVVADRSHSRKWRCRDERSSCRLCTIPLMYLDL
jgi:ribosome production factor 1